MTVSNKLAYTQTPDNLIYDSKHPVDAENLEITLAGGAEGEIQRGQVIDLDKGVYSIHAKDGVPTAIAAETRSFGADDSTVVVPSYVSGSFRTSEIIASPALGAADIEALREKGIFLK